MLSEAPQWSYVPYSTVHGSCPLSILRNATHVNHSHRFWTHLVSSFLWLVLVSLLYLFIREPWCVCEGVRDGLFMYLEISGSFLHHGFLLKWRFKETC